MEDKIILAGEPVCDVIPTCDVPMTTPNECPEPQCACGECDIEKAVEGDIHVKFTDLATVLLRTSHLTISHLQMP